MSEFVDYRCAQHVVRRPAVKEAEGFDRLLRKIMKTRYLLETYRSKGQWYWRVRTRRNKKIVADGAEGYASSANLNRAVLRLPLNWRDVQA